MIILPFTTSFALLVTVRLLQIMSLGAFCTADASLIVYLLGPVKSRSVSTIQLVSFTKRVRVKVVLLRKGAKI